MLVQKVKWLLILKRIFQEKTKYSKVFLLLFPAHANFIFIICYIVCESCKHVSKRLSILFTSTHEAFFLRLGYGSSCLSNTSFKPRSLAGRITRRLKGNYIIRVLPNFFFLVLPNSPVFTNLKVGKKSHIAK